MDQPLTPPGEPHNDSAAPQKKRSRSRPVEVPPNTGMLLPPCRVTLPAIPMDERQEEESRTRLSNMRNMAYEQTCAAHNRSQEAHMAGDYDEAQEEARLVSAFMSHYSMLMYGPGMD